MRYLSKFGIIGRGLLYMLLAAIPEITRGIENKTARVLIWLNAAYQVGLTLRAYIDSSTTQGHPGENAAPLPVTVQQPASQPVPVTEKPGPISGQRVEELTVNGEQSVAAEEEEEPDIPETKPTVFPARGEGVLPLAPGTEDESGAKV